MDSYRNLIEVAELVSGRRDREPWAADDSWRIPVPDVEIDDDDGPETWTGLFA